MIKITFIFILTTFCLWADVPASTHLSDIPVLSNKSSPFRGKIIHNDFEGYTYVTYPHVENSGSLGIDPLGRIFVVESNRFKFGVQDLRSARYLVARDFQSKTLDDRMQLYKDFSDKIPMDWYTSVPDRIIRLEDRDGNGVADYRSVFSDDFNETLDGISFSVLAERNGVYFTSIPALRKLTDIDDDGIADTNNKLIEGFGVRISFTGHDLHGIIRGPDGRLYFSVGDRGYYVSDQNGVIHSEAGQGAVFRCESDGSGFEVFAHGLRNPQELAFDNHGNLFTFDNTGDIGDKARVVYVLENSDSGWDMAHQSAHQYVKDLDWGDFHIKQSVWVGEKMYDVYSEDQPQWVYPPADHLGNGPSGVAWITGDALPKDLQNTFLVSDYRGSASRCKVHVVSLANDGAGFRINRTSSLVENVGIADVAQGYDGNVYFADFGGGWSVNKNGSVQVIRPKNIELQNRGKETSLLFAEGFEKLSLVELVGFLGHPDQRVRQASQFSMVNKGVDAIDYFSKILGSDDYNTLSKLHSVWGLGQLARSGNIQQVEPKILELFDDENLEIRANAARIAGSANLQNLAIPLLSLLEDPSPRVVSLAVVSLGRIGLDESSSITSKLFQLLEKNKGSKFDPVIRHSCISALDRLASTKELIKLGTSKSVEQRLVAVILLRKRSDSNLMNFLDDDNELVRTEAIRAIYDTAALDGLAGQRLAAIKPGDYSYFIQSRIAAANFRLGTDESAVRLLSFCSNPDIDKDVKTFIFHGLLRWGMKLDTDPVLGHYRPIPAISSSMSSLNNVIGADLKNFLIEQTDPDLKSLATNLAQKIGLSMDADLMRSQISDKNLDAQVRVANLNSMADLGLAKDNELLISLLQDEGEEVRANAFWHCIDRGLPNVLNLGLQAIKGDTFLVARKVMEGLVVKFPESMIDLWKVRELELRPELWLDLYLLLSNNDHAESKKVAALYAAGEPSRIHALSLYGGDLESGEKVFRNQGACMQCHQIDKEGGVQGPSLSLVGDRLEVGKLLESIVNPSAEITAGYGLSTISTTDGISMVGRVVESADKNDSIVLISPDQKETIIERIDIESISPPVSAMPALGLTLSPVDLRDLIAFLKSRNEEYLLSVKNNKHLNVKHGEQ